MTFHLINAYLCTNGDKAKNRSLLPERLRTHLIQHLSSVQTFGSVSGCLDKA